MMRDRGGIACPFATPLAAVITPGDHMSYVNILSNLTDRARPASEFITASRFRVFPPRRVI
jgi:hypothetical protein